MQTSVSFRNLEPSEHLKAYVSEKLNRFDKLLDNPAEAGVVLVVEKHRHIAEVNITGDRLSINGKEETGDMYSAIDMVLDKLEKQLKRSKQKIRERRAGAKGQTRTIREEPSPRTEEDFVREVKIESLDVKPMDVEEAVLQMDLSDQSFLVFTNARSSRINVIYRRKDGHYGLVQPRS
ncbi:MAG: ribosome-associated translation inhibitor RaiA [Desulfobacterales bacterium]|jgi:putative sigma-54 modulation protein|nr:ribosome-associated translation inhibitor RaiA [Desulfobacterales bacterium]